MDCCGCNHRVDRGDIHCELKERPGTAVPVFFCQMPFLPSARTFRSQRFLFSSGTYSAEPNHVKRVAKPANHKIPHRSCVFAPPGKSRTISCGVPLVTMIRAVFPR